MSNPTVECSRCGRHHYIVGDSIDCPHRCHHELCHADLEAENARLQAALRQIEALPVNQALTRRIEVEAHEIARAALAATPKEKE